MVRQRRGGEGGDWHGGAHTLHCGVKEVREELIKDYRNGTNPGESRSKDSKVGGGEVII